MTFHSFAAPACVPHPSLLLMLDGEETLLHATHCLVPCKQLPSQTQKKQRR